MWKRPIVYWKNRLSFILFFGFLTLLVSLCFIPLNIGYSKAISDNASVGTSFQIDVSNYSSLFVLIGLADSVLVVMDVYYALTLYINRLGERPSLKGQISSSNCFLRSSNLTITYKISGQTTLKVTTPFCYSPYACNSIGAIVRFHLVGGADEKAIIDEVVSYPED